jgi:acyl-coenzyme A thioesterase PaaI-like protein
MTPMPSPGSDFTIDDARRVLDEVFAPWIRDLALRIESIEPDVATGAAEQYPGARLRMPFSKRLRRDDGIVCGQALMAFADTAMVTANRFYRPSPMRA